MSILDGKLFFADDVLAPATGGVIGDVIDTQTSSLREEFYHGEPVWWVNLVTSEASNGFDIAFSMKAHSTEDVDAGEVIIESKNYIRSLLVPGTYWNIIMPLSNAPTPRYIGAALDVGSFDITGMRVTSYLTITPPSFGWEKTKDLRP